MDKRSSVFNALHTKSLSKAEPRMGGLTLPGALGAMVSLSLLLVMLSGKPELCLWIAGIAALILGARMLYPHWQKQQQRPVEINFNRLKTHALEKYIPWIKSLHKGHDPEVTRLAKAMARDLSLAMPGKVLGAHLLAGPKGTGKTQLSALVGQALYGNKNVIVFDFKTLDLHFLLINS